MPRSLAPARVTIGLALALLLVGLVGATSARADCLQQRKGRAQAPVLYLGTFTDPLGHRASFYLATDTGAVLGPIDHQHWGGAATGRAPNGAAGALGQLVYVGYAIEQARPSAGMLVEFRPSGKAEDAAALERRVASLGSPFLLGLLAGKGPAQAAASKRLDALDWTRGDERDDVTAAMIGLLYAAPRPVAEARFAGL